MLRYPSCSNMCSKKEDWKRLISFMFPYMKEIEERRVYYKTKRENSEKTGLRMFDKDSKSSSEHSLLPLKGSEEGRNE